MQFHLKVEHPEFVVRSTVKNQVQLVHLSRLHLCTHGKHYNFNSFFSRNYMKCILASRNPAWQWTKPWHCIILTPLMDNCIDTLMHFHYLWMIFLIWKNKNAIQFVELLKKNIKDIFFSRTHCIPPAGLIKARGTSDPGHFPWNCLFIRVSTQNLEL